MSKRLIIAMWLAASAGIAAQDWPQFRGANASGVAGGSPPLRWDLADRGDVAFRTSVPGLGHSSPVVWRGHVFLTSAVPASDRAFGIDLKAGIDAAPDMVQHEWRLYKIDMGSGQVVWHRTAHQGLPRIKRHRKASHASATPATDGQRVVALMGSEGLFCYDMDGRLLWKNDLGALDVGLVEDPTYQWGPASSPVIHRDLVIVQNDRQKDSVLLAFDLQTGKERWRASRDELPSWSTPTIVEGARGAVVVTNSPRFIRGHDVSTGKELWSIRDHTGPGHEGEVKVPTPVTAGNLVIVTGGYPLGARPIRAIRVDDGAVVWSAERGSPYTTTPIVYDGILYVCTDNGILSAYDMKTGARLYQQRVEREGGGNFSASPVAADGRIYLTSEDGRVSVVRAGRTFELLATSDMKEICMATPSIAGDMILIRTRTTLYGLTRGRS